MMYQEVTHNRRKSERIIIKIPVQIEVNNNSNNGNGSTENNEIRTISGVTMNISSGGLLVHNAEQQGQGGVLILTEEPVKVGELNVLKLEIPLPGFVSTFKIKAEALRCEKSEDYYGKYNVAYKFKEIVYHEFNIGKLKKIKSMIGMEE